MQTEGVAHGPATLFLHCGSTSFHPAIDGFVGDVRAGEARTIIYPDFVSIATVGGERRPHGNYGSAFLPAIYQGTAVGKAGGPASDLIIRNLAAAASSANQRPKFSTCSSSSTPSSLRQHPGDSEMEAVINSYELAWRMQGQAPDALDLSKESPENACRNMASARSRRILSAAQCLMGAGVLCESGVRYIQVTYRRQWRKSRVGSALEPHQARRSWPAPVDRPIGGLLADLKIARPARRHAGLVGR